MALTRITAPTDFTGDGPGDVPFVAGVAVTDNLAVISYCRDAGYRVEPAQSTGDKPAISAPDGKPAGRSRARKGGDA